MPDKKNAQTKKQVAVDSGSGSQRQILRRRLLTANAQFSAPSAQFPAPANLVLVSVLRVADYLIVLRPTLLFPVWTLVFLGYYWGLLDAQTRSFRPLMFPGTSMIFLLDANPQLWGTICLYSMLAGATYIINQFADREPDELNNKLYLVARGYVKPPVIKAEAALLFAIAIAWAALWYYNKPGYLILIGLSVALGVIYSAPPFRLKGRPLLDLLANAIGYGAIAFLVGWAATAPITADAILRTLPYVLCVGAAFVNTTLPDLKGDSARGDRTTGVWLGLRRSCQLSLILLTGAILSAWLFRDGIALITGVVCLPFFVYINFNRRTTAIITATRIGILTLTFFACIVFPYYFILFAATLFFVRWYYRARFGVKYP
jgi:4-hydroxybenzoate polyprenyltransferase